MAALVGMGGLGPAGGWPWRGRWSPGHTAPGLFLGPQFTYWPKTWREGRGLPLPAGSASWHGWHRLTNQGRLPGRGSLWAGPRADQWQSRTATPPGNRGVVTAPSTGCRPRAVLRRSVTLLHYTSVSLHTSNTLSPKETDEGRGWEVNYIHAVKLGEFLFFVMSVRCLSSPPARELIKRLTLQCTG